MTDREIEFQESDLVSGDTTFEAFKDEPDAVRAAVYTSIGLAILDSPEEVPYEQVALLSYGLNRDKAARTSVAGTEFEPFLEVGTYIYGDSPLAGNMAIGNQLMQYDRIQDEPLFIPAVTAGLVTAWYASPTLLPVMGAAPATMAPAGGIGALGTSALAGKAGILWAASRLVGAAKAGGFFTRLLQVAGAGSAATLGIGGNVAIFSVISNFLDPEGNQTQEDLQAEVAQIQLASAQATQQEGTLGTGLPEGITAGASGTAQPTLAAQGGPSGMPLQDQNLSYTTARPPNALDVNAPLAGQIAPSAEALNADDPLLRVPYDYSKRVPGRTGYGSNSGTETAYPIFRLSDVQDTLKNLSVGNLLKLQGLAIRAGFINPDSNSIPAYNEGVRGLRTEQALELFMGQANFDTQEDWWVSAEALAKAGDKAKAQAEAEGRANRPGYTRRPYLAPDPATINELTDRAAERQLGRKINDWERRLLSAEYESAYRQNYEAAEASNEAYTNAQYRAADSNTGQTSGTFQDVDPKAQFDQKFRSIFDNEIDRRDRTERVASMTGNLMQGLSNAERAVVR